MNQWSAHHRGGRVTRPVGRVVVAASLVLLGACSATVSGHGQRVLTSTPAFSSVPTATTPPVTTPPVTTAPATTAPPATPTRPTLAVATAQLNTLTGGAPATVLVVGAGFQAVTYDQTGHVAFWTFGSVWKRAGASTYPYDGTRWPADASAIGTVLTGMSDATFIVNGNFSGDSSANAAAYTNGPNGWGVIKAEANGNLISSGVGVDFSSIGLENDEYFLDGQLETAECSINTSTADCSGSNRVLKFWAWNGHDFSLARTAGLPR